MTAPLLEIRNLVGGYEQGSDIIHDVDFALTSGDALGVVGLNGSGKSTLGKAIVNLLPYRSGHILFDGCHIEMKSIRELAQSGINIMHQGGVVFPNLSVRQNLILAEREKRIDKAYYDELEHIVPLLQKPKNVLAHSLSGGERQELALAMALINKPKLLILDEPSAGLSPQSVETMFAMLEEIRSSFHITIILIEQNISKTVMFCNKCILLEDGSITNCFFGKGTYLSELTTELNKHLIQ